MCVCVCVVCAHLRVCAFACVHEYVHEFVCVDTNTSFFLSQFKHKSQEEGGREGEVFRMAGLDGGV